MKWFFSVLILCFTASCGTFQNKTVFLSILARNKAHILPRYLSSIENLDYDKEQIIVYINTNNNDDDTEEILKDWAAKKKNQYREIIFESHHIVDLPSTNPHDWTSERFKILGEIRNKSLQKAKECHADYYFVVDCDNLIIPSTLKTLISKDKPIVAPLLRAIPEINDPYSNYFCDITDNGYYKDHPNYWLILEGVTVGTFQVPVVHCTYLIKSEYFDQLSYLDDSRDYEFIIFSRIARNNGIDQYICNEENFGVLVHFHKNLDLHAEKTRMKHILSLPSL